MPTIRFAFDEVIKVVPCPRGKARMIIQEICGVSAVGGAYLGGLDTALIACYQWMCQQGHEQHAFRVCKKLRECGGFAIKLTIARQLCETGDPDSVLSSTDAATVVLYENRYVGWCDGDKFLDLVTSEMLESLPHPPEYFAAWNATAALIRIIKVLTQGAKQDAKPTSPSTGPAHR